MERVATLLSEERIWKDLVEWTLPLRVRSPRAVAEAIASLRIAETQDLDAAAGDGPIITDDLPLSEYDLLRSTFGWDHSPPASAQTLLPLLAGSS